MSIIHEALKKTGQPIISDNAKNPKTTERDGAVRITPVSRAKASAGWKPYLVLAVVVIAAAPLFAGRILSPGQTHAGASRPLGQFGVEVTPVAPPPFAAQAPQSISKQPFALSGVVYAGPDSYCLINGLVLKPGQKVDGATVEKISPEGVTLDLAGQTITLSSTN